MNRLIPPICALFLSGLSLVGGLGCGSPEDDALRPNVVVIVIDTLRADRLPFYGSKRNTAPFLDSLARQGLIFDNAWATSSWTAPATASIFTGMYPNEHGVRLGLLAAFRRKRLYQSYELNRIPNELETLPVFMKTLGYRTFGASTNPNVGVYMGFDRGFDRFADVTTDGGVGARHVTQQVLEWKPEILGGGPFFLYLHFMDPHGPFHRHEEWIDPGSVAPANNADDIAAYDSEIRHADEHIRTIFEELSLVEGSIVVLTSDHGQAFLEHGTRGHGFQLYSELTRVPLFFYSPADPRVRGRARGTVSNADILATLRDLLGVAAVGDSRARSLLEAAVDGYGNRQAFSMRTTHKLGIPVRIYSVVEGRFKLIAHEPSERLELYDLAADPAEKSNLVKKLPDVVARLQAALAVQRAEARARPSADDSRRDSLSAETIELLEVLGYGEGGLNAGERN